MSFAEQTTMMLSHVPACARKKMYQGLVTNDLQQIRSILTGVALTPVLVGGPAKAQGGPQVYETCKKVMVSVAGGMRTVADFRATSDEFGVDQVTATAGVNQVAGVTSRLFSKGAQAWMSCATAEIWTVRSKCLAAARDMGNRSALLPAAVTGRDGTPVRNVASPLGKTGGSCEKPFCGSKRHPCV